VTTLQNPSFGFGTVCAIYPESQRAGPDADMLAGKDTSYRQPHKPLLLTHWTDEPSVS